MNRACHQLLASSSLACDQHGCVGGADTMDSLQRLFESWGVANDAVRYLPSATESTRLRRWCHWVVDHSRHDIPPTLSNRSIQCVEQRAVVERFFQKC